MTSIEERWREFIHTTATNLEASDPDGAMLLRECLLTRIPPDEESLEWAKEYITFQQSCYSFVSFCNKKGKMKEALLILLLMEDTNSAMVNMTRVAMSQN